MFLAPMIFCTLFTFGAARYHPSITPKQCDNDCMSIIDCAPAFKLVNKGKKLETYATRISKIKRSICTVPNNKMKTSRSIEDIFVCCSDFIEGRFPNIDAIENHVNQRLLPKPNTCGQIIGNNIAGGYAADLNEFPWMVILLEERYGSICGGSLINERYILSAAHCVVGVNIIFARLGEYDTTKNLDCDKVLTNYCIRHQDIRISKVMPHEQYKRYGRVNDIALLRLKKPANYSYDNIKPVCLPMPLELRNRNLDDVYATIVGWGQTENSLSSSVPLKADIRVRNKTMCDLYYPSSSINHKFCAGSPGKDSCKGDSGGPLVIIDNYYTSRKFVQYGIVSHGYDICNGLYPGVYVDVRHYLKWILDSIEA